MEDAFKELPDDVQAVLNRFYEDELTPKEALSEIKKLNYPEHLLLHSLIYQLSQED